MKPNQIPDEIINDPILNQRIVQFLPENYNFEIHKTIWRIRQNGSKRICLQFPDGLFIFAVPIVDILREFLTDDIEFIIMADVAYGACCVDDMKAREMDCDMLVHYGHSCLVPINRMASGISLLYVFVDIKFDLLHFIQTVVKNFTTTEHRICLTSTIQFIRSTHMAGKELREKHSFNVYIPQSRPLTPGEILGCTAPTLKPDDANVIIFIADGRFHLEALMIANPELPAYRYDPYSKDMTREHYQFDRMIRQRTQAIKRTEQVLRNNQPIGIIVGTLGRQGSLRIADALQTLLRKKSIQSSVLLFTIAEINPKMLAELGGEIIECWIQIGCPRLSIDWGADFVDKPLLTPYEFRTAIENLDMNGIDFKDHHYPMDFYATSSLGNWTPNHKCHDHCKCEK
ncbi:diphthamide biosynthesis protein 1-like protein [Euroglyphus maynei]|uniref:2-(3-amino-3-carboxypropyl)histidine synthase subunit 1 n=1 Tax=Euroglyphus maynei TaxID=6958 RepID=A0A1Y3B5R2_EURMA|nr:diphthamide biosynthesis protein 1-like protein [Euroglyphus maynei]